MKPFQSELPILGPVFNLAPEQGVDIDRVLLESRQQLAAECAAKEFSAKMQMKLSACPGFVACDSPASEESPGRVIIEPAHTLEAVQWLKRRFQVAENIAVDCGNGLCIDIRTRSRRSGGKRQKFTGCKVEQFELAI
jgi:hypothetical protein